MFHFDYDAGRWVFDRLTCKSRVSKLFLARFETTTKGTGTFVVVLARCVGGNVCESNTSKTFCTPRNGFEDRGAHRGPSVPKRGGIVTKPNMPQSKRAMRKPLAQRSQTAGLLVEHCKAHGIQVLQDADGSLARHAQSFTQHTRGGGTASSLDSRRNNLTRMGLGGGGQGNVALDFNDRVVERKLAQCTRHGVAIELKLLAHLGKRRRIKTSLVQQGNDTLASLAYHAYRRSSGMRVDHLGTFDGAHATRAPPPIGPARGDSAKAGRVRHQAAKLANTTE